MLLRSNLGRSLRTLAALVRLEAMTMANYRWWLVAMQAAGLIVPMVSLLAWRGAIAAGAQAPVTGEYLTTYLVAVSLVTLVTSSWTSGFLADSIRLGTLNGWLVRPCSTHLAAVANNLGEKLAKLVVLAPMVVLVAVVFRSSLDLTSDATTWALFLLALALGGVMAFALDVVVGSLAFWLEDVSGIDRFRAIAIRLLSGAIVPLAALPATWQPFLDAQPFRYLVAFPLEVLLSGADDDGTRVGLFWQAGWTAVLVGVAVLVWRRGLGRYQGGGSMIRVWLALLRQAVMRDLQFRSQAWLNLAAGLAELGVGLVPVLVLESYASDSSGLSTGSGVLIVAFYGIAAGVVDCFVAPGLRRFDVTLRRGELDLALLRPGSTFVIGILRWMQPPELGKLVAGLALLGHLVASEMVPVSALGILAAVVWLAVGVVVFSCFWTNLVLLAFWTRSIEPINDVAAGVRTAGQYPLDYFPAWARALFVTVAPAGLLAAVPSEQLMASTWPVLAAVPAATAAVTLTAWHWRSGLRHYESASS